MTIQSKKTILALVLDLLTYVLSITTLSDLLSFVKLTWQINETMVDFHPGNFDDFIHGMYWQYWASVYMAVGGKGVGMGWVVAKAG